MKSATRLPRAVTENLIVRELDDETLVYDLDRDKAHCLNRTAALVWKMCDGQTTVDAAARSLETELNTPVNRHIVSLAIRQLQEFSLVENGGKVPPVSRRDLVLKYAPVALALPVIMSISAPTPAQAATCIAAAQPCSPGQTCCPAVACPGSGICP